MTYQELFNAMAERVGNGCSFMIDVNTWRHSHAGVPGEPQTEWKVYSVDDHGVNRHGMGPTPEAALADYDREKPEPEPVKLTSLEVGSAL